MMPAHPFKPATFSPVVSLLGQPDLWGGRNASRASKPSTRMSWATPRPGSPRACQTARIVQASGRGQPSAMRPTKAMQNVWPHHLPMEAMKLTAVRLSRPRGRVS
jgi:hypothetical protein